MIYLCFFFVLLGFTFDDDCTANLGLAWQAWIKGETDGLDASTTGKMTSDKNTPSYKTNIVYCRPFSKRRLRLWIRFRLAWPRAGWFENIARALRIIIHAQARASKTEAVVWKRAIDVEKRQLTICLHLCHRSFWLISSLQQQILFSRFYKLHFHKTHRILKSWWWLAILLPGFYISILLRVFLASPIIIKFPWNFIPLSLFLVACSNCSWWNEMIRTHWKFGYYVIFCKIKNKRTKLGLRHRGVDVRGFGRLLSSEKNCPFFLIFFF